MRLQIKERFWYACEFIGDEFDEDCCSYSPMRVDGIKPLKSVQDAFVWTLSMRGEYGP
tara:strand:- start:19502 stop:19675 length:174 start_codon:yes stop_codon:yes gene_type:complete